MNLDKWMDWTCFLNVFGLRPLDHSKHLDHLQAPLDLLFAGPKVNGSSFPGCDGKT